MRLNRKCRRTLRDERAGLTFRWRSPGGSTIRILTAGALAAGLFVTFSSLFDIKGKSTQPLNLGRGAVPLRFLDPGADGSAEIVEWAKQHSPFPDQWEPAATNHLEEQIAMIEQDLRERLRYRPLLRPLSEYEREVELPEVFELGRQPLPPIEESSEDPEPSLRVGEVQVTADARALEGRWKPPPRLLREVLQELPDEEPAPDPAKMLGIEHTFLVRLDPSGEISFCQTLSQSKSRLDDALANWLRGHKGEADPQATEGIWSKVDVSIKAGSPSDVPQGGTPPKNPEGGEGGKP